MQQMANKIYLGIFCLMPLMVLGQSVKIVAVALNGKTDSVVFGYKDNATIGIDSLLGEKDIYNQPTKEVDMRIVQRDSLNFSCTYTFSPVLRLDTFKHYFPTKFDSKVNYRKKRDTSFINQIFEIKFFTNNIKQIYIYPLVELLPGNYPFSVIDTFDFYVDSCLNKVNVISINWAVGDPSIWPIFFSSRPFSNLIFIFKKNFILKEEDITVSKVRCYPNPFKSQIVLDNLALGTAKHIRVFDVLGREVFSKKDDFGEQTALDLRGLGQGTYFLSVFDQQAKRLFSQTIVKQ